jgi:hypothetical protein
MTTLGSALLIFAAIPLVAFPFCYHLSTRGTWRKSVMGWHLMSFMAVLGVVMVFALLNLEFTLPSWVRPFAWVLVAGVAWWRLILLFVIQHRETADDRKK